MALQGTIKDFGLSDILQLIGIQRKTGILTLENDHDTVTVHFHEGQVVGADTRLRNLEDLLGGVLVRTGRITEDQLQEALRIQKKTLQRLGYLLVKSGAVSEDDLRDALRVQVTQIVYRLFRWRDGTYRFTPVEHLEYDREHFMPVSAETILMEGARMVDEWPILERKIRSDQMLLHKTPAAAALEAPVESLVDADIDFHLDADTAESGDRADGELRVSPDERAILRMVDGQTTVRSIVERSPLGEFDVYRVLYELLNRHLIEEVPGVKTPVGPVRRERFAAVIDRTIVLGLLVIAALSVATFHRNPLNTWKIALDGEHVTALRTYTGRGRIERIERGLRVFYLDLGALPDRLVRLAQHGYVAPDDLVDPWGRAYGYEPLTGGYRLLAWNAAGDVDPDLSVTRRLSAAQRMLLEGPAQTGRGGPPAAP